MHVFVPFHVGVRYRKECLKYNPNLMPTAAIHRARPGWLNIAIVDGGRPCLRIPKLEVETTSIKRIRPGPVHYWSYVTIERQCVGVDESWGTKFIAGPCGSSGEWRSEDGLLVSLPSWWEYGDVWLPRGQGGDGHDGQLCCVYSFSKTNVNNNHTWNWILYGYGAEFFICKKICVHVLPCSLRDHLDTPSLLQRVLGGPGYIFQL